MISFATSLLAALAALTVAPTDSLPPVPVITRTADALAAAWHVPAGRVRLVWGRLPALPIAPTSDVRLVGKGSDGWFVAMMSGGTGPLAVRVRAGVADTVAGAAGVAWGPPVAVHAGETVTFVWSRGLVELEVEGTALHDAGLGALVRARSGASDTLVGAVIGAGRARMEKGTR